MSLPNEITISDIDDAPSNRIPKLKISTTFMEARKRRDEQKVAYGGRFNAVVTGASSRRRTGVELFPSANELVVPSIGLSHTSNDSASETRSPTRQHSSSSIKRHASTESFSSTSKFRRESSLARTHSHRSMKSNNSSFHNNAENPATASVQHSSPRSRSTTQRQSPPSSPVKPESSFSSRRGSSFFSSFNLPSTNDLFRSPLDADPQLTTIAAKYALKETPVGAHPDEMLSISLKHMRQAVGKQSPLSLFFSPYSVENKFLDYFYGTRWNLKRRFYVLCSVLCFAALIGMSFLHDTQNLVWLEFYGRTAAFVGLLVGSCVMCLMFHVTLFELLFVLLTMWLGIASIYFDVISLRETTFNYFFLIFLCIIVYVNRVRWIYSGILLLLLFVYIAFDCIYNTGVLGWWYHAVLWMLSTCWVALAVLDWRRIENQSRANFTTVRTLEVNRQINETKVHESIRLLHNILPVHIIERMQEEDDSGSVNGADDEVASVQSILQTKFYHKRSASVVFIDIVDFSVYCAQVSSRKLANNLNTLFKAFDQLCDRCRMDKLKVVGDAYVAMSMFQFHSKISCEFALLCLKRVNFLTKELEWPLKIRIGIASGPLTLGVFGTHLVTFDAFGRTIRVAELLEEKCEVLKILVDERVYARTRHHFNYSRNDNPITLEASGEQLDTYYLRADADDYQTPTTPLHTANDVVAIQVRASPKPNESTAEMRRVESTLSSYSEVEDSDFDTRMQSTSQDVKPSPLHRISYQDDSVPDDSAQKAEQVQYANDLRSETSSMISRYSSLASISMRSAAPSIMNNGSEREDSHHAKTTERYTHNFLLSTFLNPLHEWRFLSEKAASLKWASIHHSALALLVAAGNWTAYIAFEQPQVSLQGFVLMGATALHLLVFAMSVMVGVGMFAVGKWRPNGPLSGGSIALVVALAFSLLNMILTAVVPFFFLDSKLLVQMSVLTIIAFMYTTLMPLPVRVLPALLFVVGWNTYHMVTDFVLLHIQHVCAMLVFVILLAFAAHTDLFSHRQAFVLQRQVRLETKKVVILDKLLDKLILSSLPREAYDRMRVSRDTICDWMPNCCIMFLKLWGFAEEILNSDDAKAALSVLERLFSKYDEKTLEGGDVYKIKSSGEYYLARGDSTLSVLLKALEFLNVAEETLTAPYHVTIGVTTGPVVMAVLGSTRLNYDCFSSTVNLASRLCTTSEPMHLHVTSDTVNFLHERNQDLSLRFVRRPEVVNLKGIAVMQTYYVENLDKNEEQMGLIQEPNFE